MVPKMLEVALRMLRPELLCRGQAQGLGPAEYRSCQVRHSLGWTATHQL